MLPVARLRTISALAYWLVTYTLSPYIAIALVPARAVQVAVTVLEAVLITDILDELILATRSRVPSDVIAMPIGLAPTATVATTVLAAVLMTETLFESEFST